MNPPSRALAGPATELPVATVPAGQPLRWLARGLADLRRCPMVGLLHGLAAAAFGLGLFIVARERFWFLAGAFSGFLIVAPLAATGLYRVSQALEHQGRCLRLADVAAVWVPRDARLVGFGLLLALAGTGWVLTSAALVTAMAPVPIHHPEAFLRHVVLNDASWLFPAWLALGGVLVAPVYASSVVALPLLIDRPDVTLMQAILTSWRVCLANPLPMAVWAALLLGLSGFGMLTAMAGLVLVVPLLGHASWHAYRDLVPARDGAPGGAPR